MFSEQAVFAKIGFLLMCYEKALADVTDLKAKNEQLDKLVQDQAKQLDDAVGSREKKGTEKPKS